MSDADLLHTEADAAALAECRAWVSSLQAFVMEVDMQVAVLLDVRVGCRQCSFSTITLLFCDIRS